MPWKCLQCFNPQTEDIRELDYRHCSLSDVPPEVFAFERTLEELFLDSNRIKDLPRPLFHCHGLKHLGLSDNEIEFIPPAVASLINLQKLDISKNAVAGIPDNIKGCKQLTVIDASVNPLEKLPEGFTQLIGLKELYLNDTYLDYLPANFGRLSKLTILELRENHLNTLPKSIARLSCLQRLDIGQNEFSDLPEVIGSLPNLSELWCDSNRIRSIPEVIGNLKKLNNLDGSSNNISWIAPQIEGCCKLTDLILSSNELQEIPETIGNLSSLVTLKLDDNQLTILPDSIGDLSNLEELILSQNDFEILPASIGLLRKLHILNADDNLLEDLPPEIGSCCKLTILSLRSNKLVQIPAEIGHLNHLRVVNLSQNRLTYLPVSMMNLNELAALWLSDNQSQPLVPLQPDFDVETKQRVLTCFMLPQTVMKDQNGEGYKMSVPMKQKQEGQSKQRPHIRFAPDIDSELPRRLLRAPTPYPKELRAMARHARNLRTVLTGDGTGSSSRKVESDVPVVGEMISVGTQDAQIKEAKVTKPQISSGIVLDTIVKQDKLQKEEVLPSNDKHNLIDDDLKEHQSVTIKREEIKQNVDCVDHALVSPLEDITSSTLGTVTPHQIREARYIRPKDFASNGTETKSVTDSFTQLIRDSKELSMSSPVRNNPSTTDIQKRERIEESSVDAVGKIHLYANTSGAEFAANAKGKPLGLTVAENQDKSGDKENYNPETQFDAAKSPEVAKQQPPPYHIAAAYSKQAAYFNSSVEPRYTTNFSSSYVRSSPSNFIRRETLGTESKEFDSEKPKLRASTATVENLLERKGHQITGEDKKTPTIPSEQSCNVASPRIRIEHAEGSSVNCYDNVKKSLNEEVCTTTRRSILESPADNTLVYKSFEETTAASSSFIDQNNSTISQVPQTGSQTRLERHLDEMQFENAQELNQFSKNLNETYSVLPSDSSSFDNANYTYTVDTTTSNAEVESVGPKDVQESEGLLSTIAKVQTDSSCSDLPSSEKTFSAREVSVEETSSSQNIVPDVNKLSTDGTKIPVSSNKTKDTCNSESHKVKDISMEKPATFTQDKPTASETVVAPTPQRPMVTNGLSVGIPSNVNGSLAPQANAKKSGIPRNVSASSLSKERLSKIPASKIPSLNPSPTGETSANAKAGNKLGTNWQPAVTVSSATTRLPQPGFYSLNPRIGSQPPAQMPLASNPTIASAPSLRLSGSKLPSLRHFPEQNTLQGPRSLGMSSNQDARSESVTISSPYTSGMHPSPFGTSVTPTTCIQRNDSYLSSLGKVPPTTEGNSVAKETKQPASSKADEDGFGAGRTRGSFSRIPTLASVRHEGLPSGLPRYSNIPTVSNETGDMMKNKTNAANQGKQSKLWMFGPHRNVTVLPVEIHKNRSLGFAIGLDLSPTSACRGICVSEVQANGPASTSLQPGDKILEVNGLDFTKMDYDSALEILANTGNVVHMMISRQQ